MPQTQSPAIRWSQGENIDHTPVAAVYAGDVVIANGVVGIAPLDIAAATLGALAIEGVFKVPKITGAIADKEPVYWDAAGSPVVGTASTGAATTSGPGNTLMGYAVGAALSGDEYVYVKLTPGARTVLPLIPSATVAATGSTQANAAAVASGFTLVTAADATKGVLLPAAVAGTMVIIKNGAAAVLKIWPASGDAINAIAADTAMSIAASVSVILVAYDATTWYTIPLLPS